ncbi:OLC1v1036999C1 [Oldenlandia corymbosa var. corymbosa]|uniref:OLC1v1036999C1 n=1 Tax=Oldenlandia corymbosa var. corymbosa TaxID=529605 RepID=A0AAV1CZA6_OLDCO|nr:OLC1v1036999C1 [Oldenlandia corymbosa var. corymbosa]
MGSSPPPPLSGPALQAELDRSFRQIVADACESHPHMAHFLTNFHFKDGNRRSSQIDQFLSSSPFSSSQPNQLESKNVLSANPNNPSVSMHANSTRSSIPYIGNSQNPPRQNNENPATQPNILPLGNPRPDDQNPIRNQSAIPPIPIETIHRIINSLPTNRSIGSSSSGEGSSYDRVIRRARSRAPWKSMYEHIDLGRVCTTLAGGSSSRNQPEPNQYCRCIEKTVMEGPGMPSMRTCLVHEPSDELLDLSMLTPHVPPPPPVVHRNDLMAGSLPSHHNVGGLVPAPLNSTIQYGLNFQSDDVISRMAGSVHGHQNVGGLVSAPLNSNIQQGLDSQGYQRDTITSIFDLEWNTVPQQPTSFSTFPIPETVPNPEIETRNWQHFNLESHSEGTGNASNLGSSSFMQEQSIWSINTIQMDSYNNALETSASMIPSSSSDGGPTIYQNTTTSERNNTNGVDDENKLGEELGQNQWPPEPNEQVIGDDDFSDLITNWPDHLQFMMDNRDILGFDIDAQQT